MAVCPTFGQSDGLLYSLGQFRHWQVMANPKPILVAGPTASGKSALALALAEQLDGMIINADALQVYDHWQILSARPDAEEEARAPHALYGHVPASQSYSVGTWLRDLRTVRETAEDRGLRPIIIGGTGLYFAALTEGLAAIPPIPEAVRARGNAMREADGAAGFAAALADRDPASFAKLDQNNPARLQRAWEVLEATGVGLSSWQAQTGPASLELADTVPLCLNADRDWLADRIDRRFDAMMDGGVLDEVQGWRDLALPRSLPAARALGAAELLDHLAGKLDLETAVSLAKTATRQFAKRQRTWFRSRMAHWNQIDLSEDHPVDRALRLAQHD